MDKCAMRVIIASNHVEFLLVFKCWWHTLI
jgi:hypothetical protein